MVRVAQARCTLVVAMLAVTIASSAQAQWRTQQIDLHPGWNAVFLEVQPEPSDSQSVFSGLPVESVWRWNHRFSPVQFVQDASTLVPGQPEWLVFIPQNQDATLFTNMFSVEAGRAYLIKLAGNRSVSWQVTGKSVVRPIDWLPDSFNLAGFYIDPASPPTFASYFAPSPAHAGMPVYRLNTAGEWELVDDPTSEPIQPGGAYWVFCDGASAYAGPLRPTLEQAGSIDFGRVLTEQVVRIGNETSATRQIVLSPMGSATPPASATAPLAGDVPLSYWDGSTLAWVDFDASLPLSIEANAQLSVRLGVRRREMTPSDDASARYQSLLEVSDQQGIRLLLPVVARGLTPASSPQFSGLRGGAPENLAAGGGSGEMRAGLWVGTASIDHVSWASDPSDPLTPTPTASEMQIRLIVHVDAGGQARLLQHVILMWKDGTMMPDPVDPTVSIVDEPGRYVLVTDDELLPQFSGASVRDGEPVGRRISSAAFGFSDPVPLSGSIDALLTSDPITLAYDDPLNPFQHRFHPDHDNLGFDFTTPQPEGRESYTIVRHLELEFTPDDPQGFDLPAFGDSQLGGLYRETIQGLHREDLHVAGTFRLHHASRVAVLNDGL